MAECVFVIILLETQMWNILSVRHGSPWNAFSVKLSQWEPEQSAIKANNKVKITKNKKIRGIHTFRIQPNNEIDLKCHFPLITRPDTTSTNLSPSPYSVVGEFISRCHHLCYYRLHWPSEWPKNGLVMTSNWFELKKVWTNDYQNRRNSSKNIFLDRCYHYEEF